MPASRSLFTFIPPLLLLAACAHHGEPAVDIPDGAIKVRDGYYMRPVGVDDDGCRMFTPYAPGAITDQAIRFQKAEGGFTMSKEEAACEG